MVNSTLEQANKIWHCVDIVFAIAIDNDYSGVPGRHREVQGHPHLCAEFSDPGLGQERPHAVATKEIEVERSVCAPSVRNDDVESSVLLLHPDQLFSYFVTFIDDKHNDAVVAGALLDHI